MIKKLRQISFWRVGAIGLLILSLFLLQAYLIRFSIGPYPSNLQEVMLAGAGVLVGLSWLFERRWPNLRGLVVFGVFVVLSGVSFLVNDVFREMTLSQIDLIRNVKFLFFAGVGVFLFMELFRGEKERMFGLKVLGWGALSFGLWSAIWNLSGHDVTHDYRLLGPLDSAVYLAYYMTPFFIVFGASVIEGWSQKELRKADLMAAVILGVLILATRSMGAIGGSFVVLSWFLVKRMSGAENASGVSVMKDWRVKGAIVLVGVAVVGAIFYTKIWPTLTTEWSSLDERGEIWVTAFEMLKDPGNLFFGVGLSQFEAHYQQLVDGVIGKPALRYGVIQPHNIFLLFWFHYGVLGVAFLCWVMWKLAKVLWRIERLDVQVAAGLGLAYMFVHGVLDTPFYKNDMLFLMLLFVQLVIFGGRGRGEKILKAEVVKGEGVGRKLGFPTLNLDVVEVDLDHGVYGAWVKVGDEMFRGAVNYGPRKSFGDVKVGFEVHLLEFEGDLYGEIVEVEVVKKIRDVRKFENIEDLKKQIAKDVDEVGLL